MGASARLGMRLSMMTRARKAAEAQDEDDDEEGDARARSQEGGDGAARERQLEDARFGADADAVGEMQLYAELGVAFGTESGRRTGMSMLPDCRSAG